LNLSVAHHIIFAECDWANWAMEQAKERCSDKLQKHQVFIEYLVFAGSLDEYMLNKIKSKDSIVDKSIDLIYK
jgi:SNF2 family DNA or RNA helicase